MPDPLFARRFDEALAQCKANLDMDPELRRSLWRMGSIYAAMGEEKEAASTFIQAFQNAGAKPATLTALTKGAQESGLHGMWEAALHLINQDDEKQDPFCTATAYIYAGNKEKALHSLQIIAAIGHRISRFSADRRRALKHPYPPNWWVSTRVRRAHHRSSLAGIRSVSGWRTTPFLSTSGLDSRYAVTGKVGKGTARALKRLRLWERRI